MNDDVLYRNLGDFGEECLGTCEQFRRVFGPFWREWYDALRAGLFDQEVALFAEFVDARLDDALVEASEADIERLRAAGMDLGQVLK